MAKMYQGPERRKFMRVPKNFSLVFYSKDLAYKKFTGTFIKDISKGGLRFTTEHFIKEGSEVVLEIGIPYLAPERFVVNARIVACKEVSRLIHEVRAQFNLKDEAAQQVLGMLEKYNAKGLKSHGLS